MVKRLWLLPILLLLASCAGKNADTAPTGKAVKMSIQVTSSAFKEGGSIPSKYTCDGQNVSPPLAWNTIPDGTKSIALIVDDPDAPRGDWVHWVVYDLPPSLRELPENVRASESILGNGGRQGTNDFGKIGYGGPSPPSGTHRYFFKVYALDADLRMNPGATKAQLLKAMEGHILAQGQLMGRYSRSR
jgi:Raf kinase inhibitor-like YbhB/YbcL family protein